MKKNSKPPFGYLPAGKILSFECLKLALDCLDYDYVYFEDCDYVLDLPQVPVKIEN